MRLAWLLLCVLVGAAPATARAGEVTGRVALPVDGIELAELGPTVVFLEDPGASRPAASPADPVVIRQRDATFRLFGVHARAGTVVS